MKPSKKTLTICAIALMTATTNLFSQDKENLELFLQKSLPPGSPKAEILFTVKSQQASLILFDATFPEGDSASAWFASILGDKFLGSFQTLDEAVRAFPKENQPGIGQAWGERFLSRFPTYEQKVEAVKNLEKSTGPKDFGLSLIKAALRNTPKDTSNPEGSPQKVEPRSHEW